MPIASSLPARPGHSAPLPVTWSPVALNARLDAERALHAAPRLPLRIVAEARLTVGRIIAQVERRELTQGDATEQLREVAHRLTEARHVEEAAHASRADAPLHLG